VNDTPSRPSPRISVSRARDACIAPKNMVRRPGFSALGACGRGRTPETSGMRPPQLPQKRWPGVT
jgi:hypothetical protein